MNIRETNISNSINSLLRISTYTPNQTKEVFIWISNNAHMSLCHR